MEVSPHEITVVVQGPVISTSDSASGSVDTETCLRSIRQHLPESKIILSTWEGANLANLDFDEIVQSSDPGGLLDHLNIRYNVNRQITGVRRGLEKCQSQFAVKMRSDSKLVGKQFLAYFGKHRERNAAYRIFDERLVCSSLFFRTPDKQPHSLLFHPSDTFQFGLTSDLKKMWNVEPAQEDEIYLPAPNSVPWLHREPWRVQIRYAEEQFLWISCLKNEGLDLDLNYSWETNINLIKQSEISIINNFVPVTPSALGLTLPDRFQTNGPESVYSYEDFIHLLPVYCSPLCGEIRIDERSRQIISAVLKNKLQILRQRIKRQIKKTRV